MPPRPAPTDVEIETLRSLVANTPAILYRAEWGEDARLLFVGGDLEASCGYTPEYFLEGGVGSFLTLLHPDDHERFAHAMEKTIETREGRTLEYRIRRRDGEIRWVSDRVRPVFGAGGAFMYHEGVCVDVTAQRRAEAELRESQALVQGLLDHTDAVVYVKDHEGRYVVVNKRWSEVVGLSEEESLGRSDHELFPKEVADEFTATDNEVRREKRLVTREESPDEGVDGRVFRSSKFLLKGFDHTDRDYVAGVSYDVTAMRRAEAQLKSAYGRMKRDLESAGRVQRALLPEALPEVDGYEFGWEYRPCDELGGDSLDIYRVDERTIALYVLDVSGHGVPASLLAITATRSLAPRTDRSSLVLEPGWNEGEHRAVGPGEVVRRLNAMNQMDPARNPHFVTMIYALLDTTTGVVRYACAGHPGPIVVRADGSVRSVDGGSPPVGVMPDQVYQELTLTLEPGDRLFLHSDGLNEQRNVEGEEFGRERLRGILASSEGACSAIERGVGAVAEWATEQERIGDDLSLVGVARLR